MESVALNWFAVSVVKRFRNGTFALTKGLSLPLSDSDSDWDLVLDADSLAASAALHTIAAYNNNIYDTIIHNTL